MQKVYILGSCRTPIGKMGGALSSLTAIELGAIVLKESLVRANITPEQVDYVYMGCVLQAGQGQNPARQAAIKAGLPTVNAAALIEKSRGNPNFYTCLDVDSDEDLIRRRAAWRTSSSHRTSRAVRLRQERECFGKLQSR